METDNTWFVQQLRVSIFPNENFDPSLDFWPQLKEVEQVAKNIDSKTGSIVYKGNYINRDVILTVTNVKIDLLFTVKAPIRLEAGATPVLNYIGDFKNSLKDFHSLVKSWLNNPRLPSINRIAFGAQLVQQVTSYETAYVLLSKFVPIELNPKKMDDFLLQLNLIAQSKIITGLKLNRLSKWNPAKVTPEIGMAGSPNFRTLPTMHIVFAELDINTDQDNKTELSKDLLLDLYSELVSLGQEISVKGIIDYAN